MVKNIFMGKQTIRIFFVFITIFLGLYILCYKLDRQLLWALISFKLILIIVVVKLVNVWLKIFLWVNRQ